MEPLARKIAALIVGFATASALTAKPLSPCRPLLECSARQRSAVCTIALARPLACHSSVAVEIRWFTTAVRNGDRNRGIERRLLRCDFARFDERGESVTWLDRLLERQSDYYVEAATIDTVSGAILGVDSLNLIHTGSSHTPTTNHPAVEFSGDNANTVDFRSER